MERKNQKLFETVLGKESAFHNPYTFIPFPAEEDRTERMRPTPTTQDEVDQQRFTGLIELKVKMLSPLLSPAPTPRDNGAARHQASQMLTIGNDVIVPASGVRGSLRTLMTILAGGTLGYIDRDLFLCQGRDTQMIIPGMKEPSTEQTKDGKTLRWSYAVLAKVTRTGVGTKPGEVMPLETRAVSLKALREAEQGNDFERHCRPGRSQSSDQCFIDNPSNPTQLSKSKTSATPWQVRFSGRPVESKKSDWDKCEGAFQEGSATPIELREDLWREYVGRHRGSAKPELCIGDIVWLQLRPGVQVPVDENDVLSIQWARWGRTGKPLSQCIPDHVRPDYLSHLQDVDIITNLFGQVAPEIVNSCVPSFASRINPDNLVFKDQAHHKKTVTMPPLLGPHPSCLAFYRECDDPYADAKSKNVSGYKVYRTTSERGRSAPWNINNYENHSTSAQGGAASNNVNRTVNLLPEGATGQLQIAVRSLSPVELAVLIQACQVPWRLGGGKPLGLGLCEVSDIRILNEDGGQVSMPANWKENAKAMEEGVRWWVASQKPVSRLRYPSAVERNRRGLVHGGQAWFKRHAEPRKQPDDSSVKGLQPRYLGGSLRTKANASELPGQTLPLFDCDKPFDDVLYGYDMIVTPKKEIKRNNQAIDEIWAIEPFSCERHIRGNETSGPNTSQNRETRLEQKGARLPSGAGPQTPPLQKPAPVPVTPAMPVVAKGAVLSCVITEPRAGKTSLWATVEGIELTGIIEDHDKVPTQSRSVGTKLPLYVISYTVYNKQIKFGWARANTPSLPARPKPSNFNRR